MPDARPDCGTVACGRWPGALVGGSADRIAQGGVGGQEFLQTPVGVSIQLRWCAGVGVELADGAAEGAVEVIVGGVAGYAEDRVGVGCR
nr:hypothetical protein [Kribbella sp. VKM Ac-2571]